MRRCIVRVRVLLFHDEQIKRENMDRTCSMPVVNEKCIKILVRNRTGRSYLEETRIILKWVTKTQGVGLRT
jgi:hypothetical protein